MLVGTVAGTLLLAAVPLLPPGLLTPAAVGQQGGSDLDRIRDQLRDARTDADKNEKLLNQVERQLDLVDRQLRSARDDERAAVIDRKAADRQASEASDRVERLQGLIGARARAVYMSGGAGELTALTDADDVDGMLDRAMSLDSLAREDRKIMPDLQAALQLAQAARERIDRADARREAAVAEIKQRAGELREVRTVRAEAQQRLDGRIEEYRQNLTVILAESAQIQAQLASSNGSGNVGKLLRPVGCAQTSPFGPRWGRMHEGIDFGCDTGTPVKAAKAGLVIQASANSGYGNLVLVDHDDGVVTAYAHNSRFAASVGDEVAAGEVIAYSGNTGNSTGPHVHFEVRINGVPNNPAKYL